MNTSPGMTGHSLVPMSARAAGISYEDAVPAAAGRAPRSIRRRAPADGRWRHACRHAPQPLPFDVRLMNVDRHAGVRAARRSCCWRRGAGGLLRQPLLRDRAASRSTATSTHNSVVDAARQRRAAAGRQLLHRRPRARRARAFESVPWVRQAVVRRESGPNRLRVHAEEHVPVALWGGESGNEKLVNSFGEVFEANVGDVEDDDLPRARGPRRQRRRRCWRMYRVLQPLFAAARAGASTRCTLSGRGRWQRELDSGAVIELGRGSDDEVAGAHAALRRARVRPGDRRATSAAARVRRPAPHRRLCGAPEGRHDHGQRRHADRRNSEAEEATWPRNTRIWSSASTSAPPR